MERCRRASKSVTAAATLTLSDSTPAASGIESVASQVRLHERSHALPLRAEDQGGAVREVHVPEAGIAVRARGERPEPVALHLAEVAGQVRDNGDRQVLDCPGRRAAHGRRHDRRAVGGQHDTGRVRTGGAPDHGAEVSRVGHLVEAAEERALDGRQLPRVGIRIRLAPRHDALVIGRAGSLGELTLPSHARLRPLGEPLERRRRTLPDPHLEHAPSPAQRLPNGVPPVDEVADHARGTSS